MKRKKFIEWIRKYNLDPFNTDTIYLFTKIYKNDSIIKTGYFKEYLKELNSNFIEAVKGFNK